VLGEVEFAHFELGISKDQCLNSFSMEINFKNQMKITNKNIFYDAAKKMDH